MKPITKALIAILDGTSKEENPEEIYIFIREKLLNADGELFRFLQEAGISEEDMAAFVLGQYLSARRESPSIRLQSEET